MGFKGILALITLCYLHPVEFAFGRNVAPERHDPEPVKHKGTIKTIKSKNGEVIDCVDIYKQPAFDHLLLKNHKIEMHPRSIQNVGEAENDQIMELQEWHENGDCPQGTIPIVRTPKSFYPRKAPLNTSINGYNLHQFNPPPGHEYAQVTLNGGRYYGVNATFNVWTPTIYNQEFSLAQLWIMSGQEDDLNTLEAGWMVRSGDNFTRFFTFWTRDNYQRTGCYNLQCSGFVQVNRNFALGSRISPVSTYNGQQYDLEVTVFKNKESGHWWLQIRNNSIGYWPDSILTALRDSSDAISLGGEVTNYHDEGHHTETDMGSGHFPGEGYKKASYVSKIKYFDGNGNFKAPEQLIPYATKPSCYDLHIGDDKTYFYFGGPGYSNNCQS